MEGIVKKTAGGIFTVLHQDEVYNVFSTGKIKSKNKLLVGDKVSFEDTKDGYVITKVHERKNEFYRPKACNIDIVLIVQSIVEPNFDYYLTDKLLVFAEKANTEPILIISKEDLAEEKANEIKEEYQKSNFNVFTSKLDQKDYDKLTSLLKDKIVLLVGNTGVGKSTLLNQITDNKIQDTSEISKKLGRGRHTTRHGELFFLNGFYLIDTPGFSSFEFDYLKEGERIKDYFRDFKEHELNCKFTSCNHLEEPKCAVREAVENGEISINRYNSYKTIYKEQMKKEEEKW